MQFDRPNEFFLDDSMRFRSPILYSCEMSSILIPGWCAWSPQCRPLEFERDATLARWNLPETIFSFGLHIFDAHEQCVSSTYLVIAIFQSTAKFKLSSCTMTCSDRSSKALCSGRSGKAVRISNHHISKKFRWNVMWKWLHSIEWCLSNIIWIPTVPPLLPFWFLLPK